MKTGIGKRLLGALMALALAAALLPPIPVAHATGTMDKVYVDSDASAPGSGTEGSPFSDFEKAVENVVPGGIIYVKKAYINAKAQNDTNPLVISKGVKIYGYQDKPADMDLRAAGIVLGGDTEMKNINLSFAHKYHNAIFVNGHSFTATNVTKGSTGVTVHLFVGGYSTKSSPGTNASLTLSNSTFGNIYTGSELASYENNVSIIADKCTLGTIYISGTKEITVPEADTWFDLKDPAPPVADSQYANTALVTINIDDRSTSCINGMNNSAHGVIVTDPTEGRKLSFPGVKALKVVKKTDHDPVASVEDLGDGAIVVLDGGGLNLAPLAAKDTTAKTATIGSLTGKGKLILDQDQSVKISGDFVGEYQFETNNTAVSGIRPGKVTKDHTYISVDGKNEATVTLNTHSTQQKMKLVKEGNGWKATDSEQPTDLTVKSFAFDPSQAEITQSDLDTTTGGYLAQVTWEPNTANTGLDEIPFRYTVQKTPDGTVFSSGDDPATEDATITLSNDEQLTFSAGTFVDGGNSRDGINIVGTLSPGTYKITAYAGPKDNSRSAELTLTVKDAAPTPTLTSFSFGKTEDTVTQSDLTNPGYTLGVTYAPDTVDLSKIELTYQVGSQTVSTTGGSEIYTDSSSNTLSADIVDKKGIKFTGSASFPVGKYEIKVSAPGENGTSITATFTLTVTTDDPSPTPGKTATTIQATAPTGVAFGTTFALPTAKVMDESNEVTGAPVTYTLNGKDFTKSSAPVLLTEGFKSGENTLTIQYAGNDTYAASTETLNFNVAKAEGVKLSPAPTLPQAATADGTAKTAKLSDNTKIQSNTGIELGDATSANVTFTYTKDGATVAEPKEAGTYQVTYTIQAGETYQDSTQTLGEFTITAAAKKTAITVTVPTGSVAFGQKIALSATVVEEGGSAPVGDGTVKFYVNEKSVGTASGTPFQLTDVPVTTDKGFSATGTNTVKAVFAPTDPTKYAGSEGEQTIAVNKASGATIQGIPSPGQSTFDGKAKSIDSSKAQVVSQSGVLLDSAPKVTVTYGGSSTAPTNAGTYPVAVSVEAGATYEAISQTLGDLVIQKVTLTAFSIAPVVSGHNVTLTATLTGVSGHVPGDGTVEFTWSGNGKTETKSASVSGGMAKADFTGTPGTTYTCRASYEGSTNYNRYDAQEKTVEIQDTVNVTFDANGGAFGDKTTVQTVPIQGGRVTAPAAPTRTGYAFQGWTKVKNSGAPIDFAAETFDGAATLYALWTPCVTFDANGGAFGDKTTSKTVAAQGGKVTAPAAPTRSGHTFQGWFNARTGGSQANLNSITSPTTFYARWSEQTSGGGSIGGGGGGGGAVAPTPTQPETPADDPKGFVDVEKTDYYYDAVQWAVKRGITDGVTAETFAPHITCVRTQTVVFLWRAAGMPAPQSAVNPFRDISPDAYYYQAILWAAEQGITQGLAPDTFGTGQSVTRGQMVTFLWRSVGCPEPAATANPFGDVSSESFCYKAVLWAAEVGVTQGLTETAFAPEQAVSRAQTVAFLYRLLGREDSQ